MSGRPSRERSQPAQQPRLRRGSGHAHRADVRDPRPQRREVRAPARRPRPRDVRRRAAGEERRELRVGVRQVVPLRRVDDEAVDRRRRAARARACRHGGSPRQRRKTGRSEMSSSWTTLAGAFARSPRSVSSIVSVTIPRPVSGTSQRSTDARASMRLSPAFGSGKRRIVRDGCRSAIPSSAARACSRQPCGTHAMCVITDVRIDGASAAASARSSASAASTSARRTPSPCHGASAVATSVRRGGGDRPSPAAPTSRRRSSGTRACRAPSRRRSRRRASTARPPRRCA